MMARTGWIGFAGGRRGIGLLVASVAAAWNGAALAGTLGGAPDDGISLWRVASALLLCLVLAVAGALALRARMGYGQLPSFRSIGQRRLRLVETLRLGRQVTLSIVACDERELLILSSDQTVQLVRGECVAPDSDGGHGDRAR